MPEGQSVPEPTGPRTSETPSSGTPPVPPSAKKAAAAQARQARREQKAAKPERTGNPRWLVPTMVGLMLLGLVWIVTTYLTSPTFYPIPPLGQWNLAVGFGLVFAGFALTMRWR